jgi:cytochrome c-type biogenesis protein CcmH
MTCQNQSVYDSDSNYSKDIKIFVIKKFKEGLNEKEIKKILTERYGEYILFKPYFNSKNLFLWLFPFILVILSMLFLLKNSKKTKTE